MALASHTSKSEISLEGKVLKVYSTATDAGGELANRQASQWRRYLAPQ